MCGDLQKIGEREHQEPKEHTIFKPGPQTGMCTDYSCKETVKIGGGGIFPTPQHSMRLLRIC